MSTGFGYTFNEKITNLGAQAGQAFFGHLFQVGRTIGFPTANIAYDDSRILPKDGVYAARVTVESHLYDAMLYIGSRPTVNTGKTSVEAYLFDFSDDIYGKNVNVRFVDRIRDSIKFDSIEELKKQLGKDEIKAKLLIANGK